VSALRQAGTWQGFLGAVVTDFAPHPYWVLPEVDRYFVPMRPTGDILVRHGAEPARISVTGMPVRESFQQTGKKNELRARRGIGEEPVVLVAAGALGMGPLDRIVCSLDESEVPWRLVVVTGHNTAMFQKLQRWRHQARHPVTVLGFAQDMHEWMEIADVLVTKPGGITLAEAMTKGLPVVLTAPLPGQEEDNARLLVRLRLVRYSSPSHVGREVADLLAREDMREMMRNNMRNIFPADGARRIAGELIAGGI
jgi:processive 1,2-diacylglycerol beta-glucosyltransferase